MMWMQEATVTMYLRQAWNDPRLQFEAGEIEKVRIYGWDNIWVPDTFFRQELGSWVHQQTVPNKLLTVNKNGDIWYVIK